MNIIPLGDRILVRHVATPAGVAEASAPSASRHDVAERGVVVAVGSGVCGDRAKDIARAIAAGDTIVFVRETAHQLTLGGVQHWILRAVDVLSIESSTPLLRTRRR